VIVPAHATPFYLVLALLMVAGNAFFVMAEFAIVKVRASRVEEMARSGLPGSARALDIVGRLDEYLSALQLGITLVSLGLGWVGERAFAPLFEPLFAAFGPLAAPTTHAVALTAAFASITTLHIVLGEQVPKLAAIRRPGLIARLAAGPIWVFRTVFYPALWVLNTISSGVLWLVGMRHLHEPGISEAELRILFADSFRRGVITSSEAEIMERATRFSDRTARDVMVPRGQVIAWSLGRPLGDNLAVARANRHTRYPVLDPAKDDFAGVINLKALALMSDAEADRVREAEMITPLLRVAADRRIDTVLAQMRRRRQHMAAVDGPSGKAIGILTMEDIIEEIFGEIEDEFDVAETPPGPGGAAPGPRQGGS
jgi:CBS domain containing-hemolysin-like protein